ncbi:MAG TPA: flagellar hook-basal body complex protein [Phycisphaerales bacterium]|nr:flagellar hook-basal body complex protein [Phycisphaerales bacterium]
MASTTAFYTGLSALNVNARNLDVIGNNISNVNTTAFKSSRMLFSTQVSRTLSSGSPPGTNTGGSNPNQVGLGVQIAGTQRNFTAGSLSTTGDPRDLAIDGAGFFIVNRAGSQLYTRAGTFRQNNTNDLVTIGGDRVQGFGVDSSFNVVTGVLQDINIPVGIMTLAEATKNIRLGGNLNAGGSVPTHGSLTNFGALGALGTAVPAPGPGNQLETTTRLVDIEDPASAGNALMTAGQTITITGAKKGTQNVADSTYTVTASSTVQDFLAFVNNALNISTTTGNNPDGSTPGAALDPATGVISIVGNTGTTNSIDVKSANVVLGGGVGPASTPFSVATPQTADGESILTSMVAYDSLGTPLTINLRMTLESKQGGNGTTWRYYAESPDNLGVNNMIGTGTLDFDSAGRITGTPTLAVSIDRTGSGAATPMSFEMSFNGPAAGVTALTSQISSLAALSGDGSPLGTLQGFSVGQDGTITGTFSNGLTRTLGQVAVATFTNPEGLVELGGSVYGTAPNSGEALITTPLELGTGKIVGGALELSNVDLSQEFVNLILASTGYSAASRIITTTDQLMQQLLAIGR